MENGHTHKYVSMSIRQLFWKTIWQCVLGTLEKYSYLFTWVEVFSKKIGYGNIQSFVHMVIGSL